MSDSAGALMVGGYLVAHFLLYVFVFRHRRFFWTENGVFMFHVFPALGLVGVMSVVFLWSPTVDRFALLIGAGAAHGIYSLSFLEVWVLSEGGYSLRVLNELVKRGTAKPDDLERQFLNVSARKKMGRLDSLIGLGLVAAEGEHLKLTGKGRIAAGIMALIAASAGLRTTS